MMVLLLAAVAGVSLAQPWTVTSADPKMVARYSPPILANGDVGMLVDYRNCQFQDVESYKTIHAIWSGYFPATCREGRRRYCSKLLTLGRAEEEVWIDGCDRAPETWSQHLDIFRAESVCRNGYANGVQVDSVAFVAQEKPVFAVRKSFAGKLDRYVFKWVFKRPGKSLATPAYVTYAISPEGIEWCYDRGDVDVNDKRYPGREATDFRPTYLKGKVELRCTDPRAKIACDRDTLTATIENPTGDIDFLVVHSDTMDDSPLVGDAVAREGFARLEADHVAAWKRFWDQSFVSLPDKEIERTYYTSMYNLKCWSTKWGVPIGILPSHWDGQVFGWGFNARAFAAAGHFEEAKRIGRFYRSILPTARWRCDHRAHSDKQADWDVASGALYGWKIVEDGEDASMQGRHLEHRMHQGGIAATCWMGYLYTGDTAFLREVYPVIKGCANYYKIWMVQELKDGRTIIGPTCDLERLPCPVRNAFLTTCGAISTLEKAADAAEILGVDAALVPDWRRIAAELRKDLPKRDGRYIPYENATEDSCAVLAGIFPHDAVPLDDPAQIAAIERFDKVGISVGNMYHVGTRICTWYAAWIADDFARLGRGEDAYRNLKLANDSVGYFNEIFEINEDTFRSCPWCQAPQATFVAAVHDMLLGDAVPASWKGKCSFRLYGPGGKPVSRSAK